MRNRNLVAGLRLALCLASPLAAHAEVSVRFIEPSRFVDAGDYGIEAERNLGILTRYFDALGTRCLVPGQRLEVEVRDVDLAGRKDWTGRSAYDLRAMTEVTWPRIDLRYVLRDAAGAVIGEGADRLMDMDYLRRSLRVRDGGALLPYEKEMLRGWFERRICGDRH